MVLSAVENSTPPTEKWKGTSRAVRKAGSKYLLVLLVTLLVVLLVALACAACVLPLFLLLALLDHLRGREVNSHPAGVVATAGNEPEIRGAAVKVGTPDASRRVFSPIEVRRVDGDAAGVAAEAGDEVLRAVSSQVGSPDRRGERVVPVHVAPVDRNPTAGIGGNEALIHVAAPEVRASHRLGACPGVDPVDVGAVDSHATGRRHAGDEVVVDIRPAQVGAADRRAGEVGPVDMRAVDRNSARPGDAGDEGRVR